MAKVIRNIFKLDTLSLVECNDGYWLYDYTVGMNLSMKAKTEQDALVEAILYYQKRLIEVKAGYKDLDIKVRDFISKFDREEY